MKQWMREHTILVGLLCLALNGALFAASVYLTYFAAPVIVDGHRFDNCTMVQEPDRQVWTCRR